MLGLQSQKAGETEDDSAPPASPAWHQRRHHEMPPNYGCSSGDFMAFFTAS